MSDQSTVPVLREFQIAGTQFQVLTQPRVFLGTILDTIATHHGVSREVICMRKRYPYAVTARQQAMWLCKNLTVRSLGEIGLKVKRSVSTVWHGIEEINADLKHNRDVRFDIVSMLKQFPNVVWYQEENDGTQRRPLDEIGIEDDAYRALQSLSSEERRPTLMSDMGLPDGGTEFTPEERAIVRDMIRPV